MDNKDLEIPEVQFNKEKLSLGYQHGHNRVTYFLYTDDGPPDYVPKDPVKEFSAKKRVSICFSLALDEILDAKNDKPINRMAYFMEEQGYELGYEPGKSCIKKAVVQLSTEEKEAWVSICKENDTLPKYTFPDNKLGLEKGGHMVVALDDKNMTIELLYIYLSMLRYIREEPGFVRSVVYLVNEKEMNFFLALVFATIIAVSRTGHHIFDISRKYGSKIPVEELDVNISRAIGLYRLIRNPLKYGTPIFTDGKPSWVCYETITGIINVNVNLKPKYLFHHKVVQQVKTVTKSKENIEKILHKVVGSK